MNISKTGKRCIKVSNSEVSNNAEDGETRGRAPCSKGKKGRLAVTDSTQPLFLISWEGSPGGKTSQGVWEFCVSHISQAFESCVSSAGIHGPSRQGCLRLLLVYTGEVLGSKACIFWWFFPPIGPKHNCSGRKEALDSQASTR